MTIPTEPIGSIPRPLELLNAISQPDISPQTLELLYQEAVRDTIKQFGYDLLERALKYARVPVKQAIISGFSPFCDDASTTREKAFAKIRARVEGTALAEEIINGR